jgi:hypothetical protein
LKIDGFEVPMTKVPGLAYRWQNALKQAFHLTSVAFFTVNSSSHAALPSAVIKNAVKNKKTIQTFSF